MFKVLSYCDFCSKLHVAHEIWTQIRSHQLLDDSLSTHPIPAANPVNVAELFNVFTSLLSNILFLQTKWINPLALLLQESVIVRVEHVLFDLLTRAKPSTRAKSTFNSFLLEYSPACERTTLATERIWVGENDDDVF